MGDFVVTEAALAAKFEVVLPHLDERQRRLVLGAEARIPGRGGGRVVARAAGVREATVSRGVSELESGAAPLGGVRRPGGGRKRVAALDPGLVPALLALVEPDERGDPMSPLRWTTRSTRNLAAALTAAGHKVSADVVADLLREQGFSLQANAKTLEGKQNPDRDAQFRYINDRVETHQAAGQPVISVDTKKKELVGQFANAGREWRPTGDPVKVDTHDFPSSAVGKAIPYGIYDQATNSGWVNVGTDHDTATFAVASLRRWWTSVGALGYPDATHLLITADAGGSNSYRTRAWKTELAALAAEIGVAITVCHFPPGTQCRCLTPQVVRRGRDDPSMPCHRTPSRTRPGRHWSAPACYLPGRRVRPTGAVGCPAPRQAAAPPAAAGAALRRVGRATGNAPPSGSRPLLRERRRSRPGGSPGRHRPAELARFRRRRADRGQPRAPGTLAGTGARPRGVHRHVPPVGPRPQGQS
jgi:Rhodopirellula transposase DDE domain